MFAVVARWVRSFPAEIWLISAATFINRSIGFLGLFAAIFFSSLSFSPTGVALALFAVGTAGIAGSVIGGRLASKHGPFAVLVVGSSLNAPLLFALAWIEDYPYAVLVVAAASVAVSQSFLAPAATVVTESNYAGDTATSFAFYRIFINVGSMVAPACVGLLGAYRFPLLFVLSGIGSIITTAVLIAGRRLLTPTQASRPAESSTRVEEHSSTHESGIARWTVIIVFGIAIAIYAQHQSGIPLSVQRLAEGGRLYAILLLINPAIIIVCELPLSYLFARLSWRYSYATGVLASGVGLAITGLGGSWTVCIIGFIIFSLGEALFAPQASAAVARLSDAGQNAKNQGYLSAAQTAGIAVGPAVGAYAALNARVPFWITILAVSVLLAVAVLVAVTPERARNTTPDRISL